MSTDTMAGGAMAGVTEYAHMLLKVSNIERSERFYVDLLGFKVRKAKPLADGRVFSGRQAKEAKLVDELTDTRSHKGRESWALGIANIAAGSPVLPKAH